MLCATALFGLTACDDATRPTEPSAAPPIPTTAAVEQLFTVRSLGTLGGSFSGANGINELGEVAGFAELPSGEVLAERWKPGQGMRTWERWRRDQQSPRPQRPK